MLIYLLRHGQTEYNAQKRYQGQRDIPLSAAGIAQLRQADFAPAVGDVTPLQRTATTARAFLGMGTGKRARRPPGRGAQERFLQQGVQNAG